MIKFIVLLITLLTLTHHVANAGECKSYLYYANGQTFKSGSYFITQKSARPIREVICTMSVATLWVQIKWL
jgi:hypothetical protein